MNALIHKQYSSGTPIQIKVYENKISVWNIGDLPPQLSIEMLKINHPSLRRNPLIADVFYMSGYIDTWGRGTLKIINSCKEAELPEPEMKEYAGGFQVTIFKDALTEEQLLKLGLNQRQRKAVNYLKGKGRITNKEYISLFNVSRITATRDLQDLVDKNILKYSETKGAGAYYESLIAS
ncbi:MAG: ATP-binding protein [Melioribacteraceae bacterium]|nr:ATP-binding protein [Melioribacteraceae bacterium]